MQRDAADEDYDGEGDFALYRSVIADPQVDADYERVLRSSNVAELREEAKRAAQSSRFKYVAIWRWDYEEGGDEALVEDFIV